MDFLLVQVQVVAVSCMSLQPLVPGWGGGSSTAQHWLPANAGVWKNAHCAVTCSWAERGGLMLSREKAAVLLWCECCRWKQQLSCFASWLFYSRVWEQSSKCPWILTDSGVAQQMLPWSSLECFLFSRTEKCAVPHVVWSDRLLNCPSPACSLPAE